MVSQINVTPLVDVMLVLLVIFMVTAPIIQQGVEVTLPSVKAEALPGKEEQFVVSITQGQPDLSERHEALGRRTDGQAEGDRARSVPTGRCLSAPTTRCRTAR